MIDKTLEFKNPVSDIMKKAFEDVTAIGIKNLKRPEITEKGGLSADIIQEAQGIYNPNQPSGGMPSPMPQAMKLDTGFKK